MDRRADVAAKDTASGACAMDFRDRHVVITGGAGALGTAVVEALDRVRRHLPCAVLRRGGGATLSAARPQAGAAHASPATSPTRQRSRASIDGIASALGFDPPRRRLCRRAAARRERRNAAAADRHELRQLPAVLPRRRRRHDARPTAAASSTSPPARRSNGEPAPAWSPMPRARPPSPR